MSGSSPSPGRWCGTPGYLTPHPGTSSYGAVHQVTSHPTQVPAVMVRYPRLPHTPTSYHQLWCGTPGYLTPHPGTRRFWSGTHKILKALLGYRTSHYRTVHQDTSHSAFILTLPAFMVRYTSIPHTPLWYQQLWCGTPGYLTPHPGTSRYGEVPQVITHPTQVPVVPPHQGDGAVHQVTSHPTQVPAVMVWYTRLPYTTPKYLQLWCRTPGYLKPHPSTSCYGVVHQVTLHQTQIPPVMVRYTRLPHTTPKYHQFMVRYTRLSHTTPKYHQFMVRYTR